MWIVSGVSVQPYSRFGIHDCGVQGQPDLHHEFQGNQSYTVKPCLEWMNEWVSDFPLAGLIWGGLLNQILEHWITACASPQWTESVSVWSQNQNCLYFSNNGVSSLALYHVFMGQRMLAAFKLSFEHNRAAASNALPKPSGILLSWSEKTVFRTEYLAWLKSALNLKVRWLLPGIHLKRCLGLFAAIME